MFAYAGTIMVSLSSVTAAVCASALPFTVVPAPIVIEARAIIVPLKELVAPRVAELPTMKKTWLAVAPPVSTMLAPAAVVSVEPIWKMKTALASPLRVKVPVIARVAGVEW